MIQGNVLKVIIILTILLFINTGQSTAKLTGEYDLNTEVNMSGIITKELDRVRGPRIYMFESNDRLKGD